MGFYQDCPGIRQRVAVHGCAPQDLPGRLAGSGGLSGVGSEAHAGSSSRHKAIRLSNESGEVLPDAQQFCFLGIAFVTVRFTVAPVQRRIDRLWSSLAALSASSHATARQLTALLGMLESLASLVPLGRLLKRPLQRGLRDRWNTISLPWDHPVELGQLWLAAVLRWYDTAWLLQGVPVSLPPPSAHLFTDASMQGWGAHLDAQVASGLWSAAQQRLHINLLEMEAVRLALLAFLPSLRRSHVLLRADNTLVTCCLNRQGGVRLPSLSWAARASCCGSSYQLSMA